MKSRINLDYKIFFRHLNHLLLYVTIVMILTLARSTLAADQGYDPLAVSNKIKIEILDLTVVDKERGREIPIRVYLPAEKNPKPIILFSHGLGGSREGNEYIGTHWAKRGFVVIYIQHLGSDNSVWQNKPVMQRKKAMEDAASTKNFLLRVKDVPAVLNQLELWNNTEGNVLAGRMNLKKIGMSGHSFGAVTTQAVSGQSFKRGNTLFTNPGITAAIMFSPSSPRDGGNPKEAFGDVKIPWMLMTGTKDVALIGNADLKSRLAVYPGLPPGGKYELVLAGAEHSAFTDRALPGDTEKRNPNHHRVILALSTAFWDAYLRDDGSAKSWLEGDGPRTILEKDDTWQWK
jgi:dienelactone hydrolase